MRNFSEYIEVIADKEKYVTEKKAGKIAAALPSLFFFFNYLRIVFSSNRQAKKNIYHRYNWVYSSLDVLHSLEAVGVKVEIDGLENLKKFEGPAIFVANHMSTLETMVLPCLIQPVKPVTYVVKKELVDFPLFGPVISARYPIVVGRKNPREDLMYVMDESAKLLAKGISIIIFPQKTRTLNFNYKDFNSLGVKIAKRNSVPVVPIALLTDAWGQGKLIKDVGKINVKKKVRFSFGEPTMISGSGSEELQSIIKFISSHLKKWGRGDLVAE